MPVGLSVYDLPAAEILELAVAADAAGFDTLWVGEHVVLPAGYGSEHPGSHQAQHHAGPIVAPDTELVDPLVLLGAVAAATTNLRLATGIYLLPLRHPLLTARAVHTLAEVAGGRFALGVGMGWLREEFEALGEPFDERASRLEEAVAVLRQAWQGGAFSHVGRHFEFGPVQVSARRVDVPIVLGGNSERALARAARLGDAWFSSGTPSLDEAVHLVSRLRELGREAGRDAPLPCYVRIEHPDARLVASYQERGIDNVVVWADQVWEVGGGHTAHEALRRAAAELGCEPRA